MSGTCHVLGLPHTATNKEYELCAFTQKVYKLCTMLKMQGFKVVHYGNEGSYPYCDENVVVLGKDEILSPADFLKFNESQPYFKKFVVAAVDALVKRLEPNDFLLCPWASHKHIVELLLHNRLPLLNKETAPIVIESGIGYAHGIFAPFKVFESYAIMHAYYGLEKVITASGFEWYNTIIPNSFDTKDYLIGSRESKEDYLLFLGMRHGGTGKGYHIAKEVAEHTGTTLVVAGPDANGPNEPYVKHVGMLRGYEKALMLSKAKALIAPSLFLEPFCGAQVEAFMSGTPVISTDWGAFTELNVEGITGFRCSTMADFEHAVREVDNLNKSMILDYGRQFSLEGVAPLYKRYLDKVLLTRTGNGWYESYKILR